MTEPRVSPQMTAKLAAIKEAKDKLDQKHFKWIVDAAIEHFAEDVAETEETIVRYTTLPELPIYSRFGKSRGDDYQGAKREKEVSKLRAHVTECYAILDFLQALSDAEVIHSAEALATAFRDSGGFIGSRGRRTESRRGG
jgi:hypothetical protein